MTRPQREHSEAVAEFDAAVCWYEEQEPGIALALIDRARLAARTPPPDWGSPSRLEGASQSGAGEVAGG